MTKLYSLLAMAIILCLAIFASCNSNNKEQNAKKVVLDTVSLSSKSFALAYQDGQKIVATSIDTMKQISFGGATDPSISPDGNKLAYTVTDSAGERSIWIADLENKSQLQVHADSKNYYGAVWSADGVHIAFSVLNEKNIWKIGLVKNDNTGFIMLDGHSETYVNSPTWKSKNEIVAHDLNNLYTFNLNGEIINTTPLKNLIGAAYHIAGDNIFFYANQGKTIIFSAYFGPGVPELHGKANAVFAMDLLSKDVQRISPNGMNVSNLFVTADDRIFFSGAEKPFTESKIYFSDLNGHTKTIVDKGTNPTGALK
ncbi:hypothetical protein [Pedobacter agri]|uniref:hypothetical protein n=1 Tax=Pedobacter agri TaxID=454586 RepID=UPI0029306CE6|nr:hypothetical protein [Pedobacter agri]